MAHIECLKELIFVMRKPNNWKGKHNHLFESLGDDTRDTLALVDHPAVLFDTLLDEKLLQRRK